MIERVAERMVDATRGVNWDDPDRENVFRLLARTAIKAMREPSEEMLDAARDVTNGQTFFANYPRKIDAMVHRAMIDAALGPQVDSEGSREAK